MASVNRPLSRRYGPKFNYVEMISLVVSESPTTLVVPTTFPVEVNLWNTASMTLTGGFSVSAFGRLSSLSGADITFSMPTVSAFGGANADLTISSFTLAATGTVQATGRADLTLAAGFAVDATGTVGGIATADLTIFDGYAITALGGANAALSLTPYSLSVSASGTVGGTGTAVLTLQGFFNVSAGATAQSFGYANLTLLGNYSAPSGSAWLVAPHFSVIASGHEIVSVTYEAYAINLTTGAVTHYTNYPFDNILRFGKEYFGVSATGLFKIGGSLDITTAIDAHIKTFSTKFNSEKMKRVPYVYSSGRSDGGVLVGVTADEGVTYEYASQWGAVPGDTNHRTVVGKGIRGVYYALDVKNVAGGSLELDGIRVDVEGTERAI